MRVAMSRYGAIALLLLSCANAGRVKTAQKDNPLLKWMHKLVNNKKERGPLAPLLDDMKERALLFGTCPYGDVQKSTEGGTNSFQCHLQASGKGNTCPELQVQRMKVARQFFAASYQSMVNEAVTYELKPLFDKSDKMRGDETYEELLHYHVEGLMHPTVIEIEDKILFKQNAKRMGVPATITHYGAHKPDWEEDTHKEAFKQKLQELCDSGTDGFMIKAIHLAWSKGQKVVKGWQKICNGKKVDVDAFISELITFIDTEVVGVLAAEEDAHLRIVTPGVSVEELFVTGGRSTVPLEVKIQCLWGKVHHMWFIGQDSRGCQVQSGAFRLYADRTGWDLKGIVDEKSRGNNDPLTDLILEKYFDRLVAAAETYVNDVGADIMRADFFIGIPESGEGVIKMNEPESVSGDASWWERQAMASIVRDGYIFADKISLGPAPSSKWDQIMARAQSNRTANNLE